MKKLATTLGVVALLSLSGCVVYPAHRYEGDNQYHDRDRSVQRYDRDRDGVPNRYDRRPYDPRRY